MQESRESVVVGSSKKKVVEEVKWWLKVYEDGSVERKWSGPAEAKFMVEPIPPHDHFLEGVAVRDVLTLDSLRFRIYLPEPKASDPEKLPIILHFHGGGFCISQPDWLLYYHFYSRVAREARCVIVSPFLRLAPEHRLPAAFDDGFSALKWVASTSEPWVSKHGDTERVFLVGDSAGGNVVHQVAARARAEGLRVAGAVPINPGFVRAERSRSEREKPETAFLTVEMVDKLLALALPLGATRDHPYTCPMNAQDDGAEVGPLLVCVSEDDLMRDTQVEYYEHMKKKKGGDEVHLLISSGMTHCFYLNKMAVDSDPHVQDKTAMLIARITDFINHH